MKKLMTMLATAAAAFGLYAEGSFLSGTAFEPNDGGNSYAYEENVGSFVPGYWLGTGAETTTVENVGHGITLEALRPAYFAGATDNYTLKIKTTFGNPVTHKINTSGNGEPIVSTGLYFDGLVNMTACDEAPNMALYEGTKIAVYIQEILDNDEVVTGTNFVVVAKPTAAVEDGRFVCAGVPEDLSGWHRLTIKAIADIGSGETGFVVFVDGNPVNCVDAILSGKTLTPAAAAWNDELGQLFVSLVDEDATIKSVAFDGQGSVDELVFTTEAPDFAKDAEFATVAWTPENVTSVTINGTVLDAAELAKGTYDAKLDSNGQFTIAWIGSATKTDSDTQTVDAADLTDNTFNIDEEIADVVALVDTAKYDDLDKAVTDANDATAAVVLKLIDVEATDVVAVNNAFVTIDLNGQTIAELGDDVETIEAHAKMTVTNSSEDLATVNGCIWAEDVEFTATNIRFDYDGNVDENDDTKPIFATTVPEGYEVKPDANQDYFEIVLKPVVKYGTVIFVCEAAGVNTTNDNLVVGEVVPAGKIPASAKSYMQITGWDQDLATYTVVEGEQTITGTADLNLTKDQDGAYQIGSEDNLLTLQAAVADGYATAGLTFKQTETIDLKTVWTGIGSKTAPFAGIYDGDDNEITGLKFYVGTDTTTDDAYNYQGLFKCVAGTPDNQAVIKNLTISMADAAFDTTEAADGIEYGGAAFVGIGQNVKLLNLTAKAGTLQGTHNTAGIAIKLYDNCLVENCTNKMTIGAGYTKASGLVCFVQQEKKEVEPNLYTVTFKNCVNEGTIKATNFGTSEKFSGRDGLAGFVAYVGRCGGVLFQDCQSKGTIDTTDAIADVHVCAASFVGYAANQKVVGSLGGNTTTQLALPSVDDHAEYLPVTATNFNFAVVAAGTASFVADNGLTKDGSAEYKVMASNKVDVVLAVNQSIKFDEALFPAVVKADDESVNVVTKTLDSGTVYLYTCAALPPPGPSPVDPSEGTVVPDPLDGSFIVTPAEGKDSVELQGANKDMTIKVTTSADFVISGLNGATVKVMCNGVDIAGVCLGGQDGNFSTALDPEKTTPTFTEGESGEEPLVIGENVGVTVTSVEGLAYTLVRGEEVGTIATDIQTVAGTGEAITLEDTNKPAGKAFYKVSVSKAEVK